MQDRESCAVTATKYIHKNIITVFVQLILCYTYYVYVLYVHMYIKIGVNIFFVTWGIL